MDRRLKLATLIAVFVLALADVLAFLAIRTLEKADLWVAHTHEVIGHLEGARAAISDAESAQLAFLLTGNPGQLAAFSTAGVQARQEIFRIRRLTADNPRQQANVAALQAATEAQLRLLARGIALRRTGMPDTIVGEPRFYVTPQMHAIRTRLAAMREEEDRLLDLRLARAQTAGRAGLAATVGTSGLAVALLVMLYLLSSAHTRRLAANQQRLLASREETREKAEQLGVANEQLRAAANELEQRVSDRTAELAEANAELEAFARTVAHDLRAPLRNIQGYATALLEDEHDRISEDGRDYVRRLIGTTHRLDTLVTDLLGYSRLARTNLRLEPTELGPLVAEVLRDLAADIAASGASIEVDEPLPRAAAHRPTLGHVLMNLVSNALKFVPPGQPPRIRISARHAESSVVVSVEDEGIGIAPEHHDRIFQVFERLHGQESYPGTGIGLAIVRKGMERMGGTVRVYSAADQGSRFELWLPSMENPR